MPELKNVDPILFLTTWIYTRMMSHADIYELYDCDNVISKGRPIYDEARWLELRRHYHGYPDDFDSPVLHVRSFAVPYEVRQDPEKGRGIYATDKIKKGDLIYTFTPHAAKFRNHLDYFKFLATVRQDMVCDILEWTFCQDFHDYDGSDEESDLTIVINLDDGSLYNHEYDDFANVGCDPSYVDRSPKICRENFFALQDIEPGEELFVNYDGFHDGTIY